MSARSVWQVAGRPDIRAARLAWPELTAFTAATRTLRVHTDTPDAAAAARAAWDARRVLISTPLAPDSVSVGLFALVQHLEAFTDERPDHSATPALRDVTAAATALALTPSPVGEWLSGAVCQYDAYPDGRAQAVLVVPRVSLAESVRSWLLAEELDCVDVATPAQLRTAPERVAVFVLGHPGQVFSSAYRSPTDATREYGWLLTAPPGAIVHIALTDDAPRLDPHQMWVFHHPTAHPPLALADPPTTAATAQVAEPLTDSGWITPGVVHAPARPRVAVDHDAVHAVPVPVAPDLTLYFDPDAGPLPQVVTVEESGTVSVTAVPGPGVLTAGHLLAVRLNRPAHAHLELRADQWLATAKGWSAIRIAGARKAALSLKAALFAALAQSGPATVQAKLRGRGMSAGYARNLTQLPMSLTYIAPHARGFDALVSVLSTTAGVDDALVRDVREHAADLVTLRTAHQQAGARVRTDLREQLGSTTWADQVEECGWATIHDADLGTLLITTVLSDGHPPAPLPRTWLAQPIGPDGLRATTASLEARQ